MERSILYIPRAAALAAALLLPSTALPAEGPPPLRLEMPLRCTPGKTCWVVNYVDHDPSDGVRDYACGTATYNVPSKQGNRHQGTDIAIRDLGEMRRGVEVLAAAAGKIIGVRDGMADVSVRKIGAEALKGKLCGNRVGIIHPGGWLTQYCHLRQGSVSVKNGEEVMAGQPIGLVGLSGFTEYPHLHIQVMKKAEKGQQTIDPFVGLTRQTKCGAGDNPLWKQAVLSKLDYRTVLLVNAGFSLDRPKTENVRNGLYRDKVLSRQSPTLYLWADVYKPNPGDRVVFDFFAANGEKIHSTESIVAVKRGRSVFHAWMRNSKPPWPPGVYKGVVRLVRDKGPRGVEEYTLTRQVTLR